MRVAFICLASVCAVSAHADVLKVAAGEEYVIGQSLLRLEQLVLEDGAVLRVAPGLTKVQVLADEAWIGRDVRLLAAGLDGQPGASGRVMPDATGCDDGPAGQAGNSGDIGGDGATLELTLGLRSFGSMLLDTRGGAGGKGGTGSNGAAGGASDRCAGGTGGRGGAGGTGGAGGRGGDVVVRYWSLSEAGYIPISNYGPGVQVLTAGGAGAPSGAAGSGGAGGTGQQVKRSTGITVFRNPGVPGANGASGEYGVAGAAGQFLIQPQARP